MAQGFYSSLRKHYPTAHIAFLSTEPVYGMQDTAFCDEKILFPKGAKRLGHEMFALSKLIREKKFDFAVSLPATFSSALILFLSAIPTRTGFLKEGNFLFLHSGLRWQGRTARTHKSFQYLSLFEFITGKKGEAPAVLENKTKREKLIVVAPGASISLREWPYFDALIKDLDSRKGSRTVIVGGPKEKEWHERLKALKLERVEDLVETTTLPSLVSLLRRAELVVANDSGVAHLAATLAEVPTVVLFGPGDPEYIAPKGPDVTALRISLACSPCEKPTCRAPFGYKACLNGLPLERVVTEINRRIGFDT